MIYIHIYTYMYTETDYIHVPTTELMTNTTNTKRVISLIRVINTYNYITWFKYTTNNISLVCK